ncbi:MAG: LmbE family protein, partial [Bacteroidota bacterium]|nr:LmbE family protein [Bacteroidota bacterium]
MSRSQHKSQGFGHTGTRGEQVEYLELLKGDLPANGNLFEGIDTSWNRVQGGAAIGAILMNVQKNYDFQNPSASLPQLIKAYDLITKLEDSYWRTLKTKQITEVIKACAGLYLEAATHTQTAIARQNIVVSVEAINRSTFPIRLEQITLLPEEKEFKTAVDLDQNKTFKTDLNINTGNAALTTAYWLTEEGSVGMYNVDDQKLIGLPETPRKFKAVFQ